MQAWGRQRARLLARACTIGLATVVPMAALGPAATSARIPRVAVHLFSLRRTIIGRWSAPGLWDVVHGSDGAVYFDATGTCAYSPCSAIGRITAAGHARVFVLSDHAAAASLGRGSDGRVWFTAVSADGLTSEIGRIAPNGHITIVATGLSPLVNGIAAGRGGTVWVGDQSNVYRVSSRRAVAAFALPPPYTALNLVEGPDGNVWFTSVPMFDGPHLDSIGRITPTGRISFFRIPTYDSAPDGIAAGPDHNLWFGEAAGRIGRITPSGRIIEFSTGYRGSEISAIVPGPGRCMWFMDRGRDAVGQVTMSGHVREFRLPVSRVGHDLFSLARGPGNSLWFTDTSGLTVGRITVH